MTKLVISYSTLSANNSIIFWNILQYSLIIYVIMQRQCFCNDGQKSMTASKGTKKTAFGSIILSSSVLNQRILRFVGRLLCKKQDVLNCKNLYVKHHKLLKAMFTSQSAVVCTVEIFKLPCFKLFEQYSPQCCSVKCAVCNLSANIHSCWENTGNIRNIWN